MPVLDLFSYKYVYAIYLFLLCFETGIKISVTEQEAQNNNGDIGMQYKYLKSLKFSRVFNFAIFRKSRNSRNLRLAKI